MFSVVLAACYVTSPGDALVPQELARERVNQWRRAADGGWVLDPTPVAWGWSSLDARVIDGELVLAGLDHNHYPASWEEPLHHPLTQALVSEDGEAWSARRYWGPTDRGGIDPAFQQDEAGDWWIWVVTAPGTGDPAEPGTATTFERARLRHGWAGELEPWAKPDSVVDVMPILFHGQLHVFGTHHSRQVVDVAADGSQTVVWDNATVPFARVVGDTLELVAQVGHRVQNMHRHVLVGDAWEVRTIPEQDRREPWVRRSTDGRTWGPPEELPIGDAVDNCASPALVEFGGVDRLFCVEERFDVQRVPATPFRAGPPP